MPRALGLDPEDPLVRQAVFGLEVQEFLQGPIGDFLLKQSERELTTALESLRKINPASPTLAVDLLKLQERIRLLEQFQGWLGEAVQAGMTATQIIDGELDAEDA